MIIFGNMKIADFFLSEYLRNVFKQDNDKNGSFGGDF
jgi:hypothetical protein